MFQFEKMFDNIKQSGNFAENARLMEYLGNVLKNSKKPWDKAELEYIGNFVLGEMQRLIDAIPKAQNYKAKDEMFYYENSLLMVFTFLNAKAIKFGAEQIETVKRLVLLVDSERVLEKAIDEMFKLEKIEKSDIEKVLEILGKITDEYQRGLLYQALHAYKDGIKKLSSEAKTALADYVAGDMAHLIDKAGADDVAANNLEFCADVCKHFVTDGILDILQKVMALKIDSVRYYALETLLENKREIPEEAVKELAKDLSYADLTYGLLSKYGKTALFPKEFTSPEYLAKSDLVHWLIYPTELNKEPDEIELIGEISIKKEAYFVFKYKSDSDNLSEDLQNEWLIGWSSSGGGTFSNFDKLEDYQKKTPQKTLKHIAKKLLK